MKEKKNIKFIRVKGRVVPIKSGKGNNSKKPKKEKDSNHVRAKKSAYLQGRSDNAKYESKKNMETSNFSRSLGGIAGISTLASTRSIGLGLAMGAIGGLVGSVIKTKKHTKKSIKFHDKAKKFSKQASKLREGGINYDNVETHREYMQGNQGKKLAMTS